MKEVVSYVTDDGTVFDSREEAEKHERLLLVEQNFKENLNKVLLELSHVQNKSEALSQLEQDIKTFLEIKDTEEDDYYDSSDYYSSMC